MGGRITYLLAGARPANWKVAGVFYGGNIMKPWGEGPAPFELTGQIACRTIGFFGLEDANPSPDDVKKIDAEMTRHGKPHEFHSYEGAGHAFLNFMNAERHRPKQGADAWSKMLAFLEQQPQAQGRPRLLTARARNPDGGGLSNATRRPSGCTKPRRVACKHTRPSGSRRPP